jgi:hypothetical protein
MIGDGKIRASYRDRRVIGSLDNSTLAPAFRDNPDWNDEEPRPREPAARRRRDGWALITLDDEELTCDPF